MSIVRLRRLAVSACALRLAVPLAAAFLAALSAHVAIDVVGDFVLAHDSYDDPAHGSRWVASIALGITALVVTASLARALFAETRGRAGAFRAALAAAMPSSSATFACVVVALAVPLLLAMAWLDVRAAGIPIDDVADLFGGSVLLGGGLTVVFALASAFGCHALLAVARRHRCSIVRAFVAFVRLRLLRRDDSRGRVSSRREHRPRVALALARRTSGDRAPPFAATPIPA